MVVSIIVPCYNQADYLAEALNSVLEQSFTDWECIIVNDGSPDHTEEVANDFCKKDLRFKYLMKENGGLSSARNAGIEFSTGKYILPLDADDKISAEYLERAIEVLDNNPCVKVVYGEVELFGMETGIWHLPAFSLRELALGNMIYCSALFRRSDFNRYCGYDESFLYGLEDWEFWLRILKDGGLVIKLPLICFYYRKKEGSMNINLQRNEQWLLKMKTKLYLKHLDFYMEQFGDFISIIEREKKLEYQLLKKQRQLDKKQEELDQNYAQIELIYNSNSYRLGNLILKPLRILMRKIKI